MDTLIIGLGNPILGDDGVGWRVAEEVSRKIGDRVDIEIDYASLGGLSLMERLSGYKQVVIIDAIFTGKKPIGTVSLFPLSELPDVSTSHTTAIHDTSLRNALKVGREMDMQLPMDHAVYIVAIEANNTYEFSEKLSNEVEKSIPLALEAVLKLINQN